LKTLRAIARAHCHGSQPDLAALALELGRAIRSHAAVLDAELASLRQPGRGFERWRLDAGKRTGMRLMVMTWPANHATPVHDHAGLWGLEMALHGAIEVESYARDSRDGDLRPGERTWLGRGDAVWFDAGEPGLHRCRNLSRHETALTLHVHGGDLVDYFAYEQARPDQPWQALPQRAAVAGLLHS
jgi:hypothetical protein